MNLLFSSMQTEEEVAFLKLPILKQTFKILTFNQLKHLDLCSDYNIQNSSQWNPITVFSNNIETILFTSKCFLIFNVKNALFHLSLFFLFFLSFFFFFSTIGQNRNILQARILEWIACPSPGDLPNPGIKPRFSEMQVDSSSAEPQGKPKNTGMGSLFLLQWVFPTWELNQGLLYCKWILYQLSYLGSLSLVYCKQFYLCYQKNRIAL